MPHRTLTVVLVTVIATVAVLAILAYVVIRSGAYNVSAAAGHSPVARWALDTAMHASVERRAATGEPPTLTTADLRAGGNEYKSMCQHCHGGPGVRRAGWAQGLTPSPPDLAHAAEEYSLAEIRWIVANGIKMSAMPPFGATHDDETIWNIAGFVKQLPRTSAGDYAAIPSQHGGGGEGGHSH